MPQASPRYGLPLTGGVINNEKIVGSCFKEKSILKVRKKIKKQIKLAQFNFNHRRCMKVNSN